MGNCMTCCNANNLAHSSCYSGDTPQSLRTQEQSLHLTSEDKTTSQGALTARNIVITDKKMFNPYNKFPPIKKQLNGEGKRVSQISREFSENKANALFDTYKDADCDCILAEGIEKLCEDLEVRPDEFIVLVLAWKLNAETMCLFTREQFVSGCHTLRTDSIKGFQAIFSDLLTEVQNPHVFKEFYRWTYKFGLDHDVGQRTLSTDMAISLWKLVFSQQEPKLLPHWLSYLQKHHEIRGISKDTWDMFLNFVEQVGDDISSYDDSEAWPSLLDDFVEYENDCQNQNVESDLHFSQ